MTDTDRQGLTEAEREAVRGVIVDQIAARCGQIPDLHPRLLEGIEAAASILSDRLVPLHAVTRWAVPRGYCGGREGDTQPVAMVRSDELDAALRAALGGDR